MLQSLLFLNALCFGVGMPLVCQENTQDIQEKVEFKQDNKKFVSYNDEEYKITLSADELNNYTFLNLVSTLNVSNPSVSLSYDNSSYSFDENNDIFLSWTNEYIITFTVDDDYLDYGFIVGRFNLWESSPGEHGSSFESSLILVCNSSNYSSVKSTIELDIQANDTQPHLQPVLTELVSLLTAGITALASGIGQGVSTLVSDIFINNGALSTFGAVICIFGGIALAIGLSRWVMNFLTSLGAKK